MGGERGVKGGRCVGLTTLLPSCADCFEFWGLQPPGTLRACRGIFIFNIPLLACCNLFEVQTDYFCIYNVDELVLREVSFITGCPIKSNKNCKQNIVFNPLNPELNPICYLLALLGAYHFLHVSRIRVKLLTFRLLISYIHEAPILDVSRSHTTTHHSR